MPCVRCGECCKITITALKKTEASEEWIKARGLKILSNDKDYIVYVIPHTCAELAEGETCQIQDDKPAICTGYPQNQTDVGDIGVSPGDLLPEGCGFKWNGKEFV